MNIHVHTYIHFKSENGEIWRVRTLDTIPALNFVKKIRGICPLGEIFTKNSKFSRFFRSPYFYIDNVKISLKRTDRLRNLSKNKFSSKSLKGPAGIALPSGGDAYCFLIRTCPVHLSVLPPRAYR